jgi:hypothetical protein
MKPNVFRISNFVSQSSKPQHPFRKDRFKTRKQYSLDL